MTRTALSCPACRTPLRTARRPVCDGCWWTLPRAARTALQRTDDHAAGRLAELHRQIRAKVPLHRIKITTR